MTAKPGILRPRRAAAAAPSVVNTVQATSGSTTNSVTVSLPSQPPAGNVLVMLYAANVSGDFGSMTIPAAFTNIASQTTNGGNTKGIQVSYKIATGSEGVNFTCSKTNNDFQQVVMWELTGMHATTPFDTHLGTGGLSKTSQTLGPRTPAQAASIAVAGFTTDGNAGGGVSFSNSFASATNAGTSTAGSSRVLASTASISTVASWTTSRDVAGYLMIFKGA